MSGPLTGLHVVEIATGISGPYAAKLFVDLGAEVDEKLCGVRPGDSGGDLDDVEPREGSTHAGTPIAICSMY